MKKINRRRFIIMFGLSSFTFFSLSDNSRSINIEINRFNNNKSVSLQNIHSVAFRIKEMNIYANNINYNKPIYLNIYGTVEDKNIGKIKTKEVNIQTEGSTIESEIIHINDQNAFSYESYSEDKDRLEINLKIELVHESIDKPVTDNVKYYLDLTPAGELETHTSLHYNSFESPKSDKLDETKTIGSTNLPVLKSSNGLDKLKKLIGGGLSKNKSSYEIPSGVLDLNQNKAKYSSPRNYRNISNSKNENIISTEGSDLPVLKSSDGLGKLKKLIGGGLSKDKSSYEIPSGVLDLNQNQAKYSSPRNYKNILNRKPDNGKYRIS